MTTNTRSPERYAETILGVHTAYEKTEQLIQQLSEARSKHVTLVGEIRQLRIALEAQEQAITEKVRVENPDLTTISAFDRKVKEAIVADETCKLLKHEIAQAMFSSDSAEAEVRTLELQVKVGTARIGELDGLLRFYAAHTEARTEARRSMFSPVG